MVQASQRDRDIDFAKGLACLMMIMGHIAFAMGFPAERSPVLLPIWVIAECSVVLFFMATGMNVIHFVRRNEGQSGWGPTRTFFLTNLAIFVCGLAYNLNRQSLGLMDLFQGIAAAAFLTYIPFRRRWPTPAIAAIAVLMIILSFTPALTESYTLSRGIPIQDGHIVLSAKEFARSLSPGAPQGDLMGKYLGVLSQLASLPLWERILFVHFSILPWTGCALLGGLVMRHTGTKTEAALWIFFLFCLAAAFYFPFFFARHMVDYFFRGKPDYMLRHVGIAGLIILALRHWYAGRARAARWVEFVGRESFLVFVLQWVLIEMTLNFLHPRAHLGMLIVFTALIYWLMTLLTRRFAVSRDKNIQKPGYAKKWFGLMFSFSIITAFLHYGFSMPRYTNIHLAHLFSYVAAVAFAMALPSLRYAMRGGKETAPAANAEPAGKSQ